MQTNSKWQHAPLNHKRLSPFIQIIIRRLKQLHMFQTQVIPQVQKLPQPMKTEQAKSKAAPHTKITLKRNTLSTTNNNKSNTQVNILSKESTDPIKLHNKFCSWDTMDVDLDRSFDKRSKIKRSNYTHLHPVKTWVGQLYYNGIVGDLKQT